MKANELRIRNLVIDKDFPTLTSVICAIVGDTIEGSYDDRKHIDEFEPIELTEEWLIKFGFEKVPNLIIDSYELLLPLIGHKKLSVTIEKGNQYITIKDYAKQPKMEPTDLVVIRNSDSHGDFYVHQLQNLYFALTGKELEI